MFNVTNQQYQLTCTGACLNPTANFGRPIAGFQLTQQKLTEMAVRIASNSTSQAGFELPGRTLGVIGLGAIGGLVADTAIKLGMKVIGFDPEITVDAAWRLPSSVRKANSIEEVLKHSDFVTLHVPLLPATRHLIDEKRLALVKAGSVLLNFARDAIVDESAVAAALRSHRLKYYLCDFPSAALKDEPNVVALPHLGASTAEAEENCAVMVVDHVREGGAAPSIA